jgi:hypothetical protein
VDAITGATQTTIALMRMLNNDLESFRNAYAARTRLTAVLDNAQNAKGGVAWH